LVGYARSIVSPEPGTTRDLLQTRIVINGWEVDLVDTAGLRDAAAAAGAGADAASAVEREGMVRAVAACADADLVLRVVDGREAIAAGGVAPEAPGELLVYSKADLAERGRESASGRESAPGRGSAPDGPPWLSSSSSPRAGVWTSVVSGEGIEKLAAGIVRRLVSEEADEPDLLSGPVPFTPRQVAAVAALSAECASLSEAVGFQPGCCREADSAS